MHDQDPIVMSPRAIAVIGAGPAGLTAGAWLARQGFEPVLFEAADDLGGQWNAAASMSSGVWPGMRTNTSRVLTAFSDLDHAPGTPVFPPQQAVLDYLHRYAAQAGLLPRLRLGTRVEHLGRAPEGQGWLLRSRRGGQARAEVFARVVVASGRYNAPFVPDIAGLGGFAGEGGVRHSFSYTGPAGDRDRAVVVAGCSISALEIASELALAGARRVTVTLRRQRYVLPKLIAGVPTDHVAFTRGAAMAGAVMPPAEVAQALRHLVTSSAGSPEQVGAPPPEGDIFTAGLTQSQHYLSLVAEGRIQVRPWIAGIDGREVRFPAGGQPHPRLKGAPRLKCEDRALAGNPGIKILGAARARGNDARVSHRQSLANAQSVAIVDRTPQHLEDAGAFVFDHSNVRRRVSEALHGEELDLLMERHATTP